MRGFAERADVEEVDAFLVAQASVLEAEPVALLACVGRVLAEDVRATVDVPGFRRAAMDGYAVRAEETFGASSYDPIGFEVLGQALPGAPWEGVLGPGQAVRTMTGAAVPDGAYADDPVEADLSDQATCATGTSSTTPVPSPRRASSTIGSAPTRTTAQRSGRVGTGYR